MPPTKPITTRAGYVPAFALGFSGPGGELEIVESAKPLPVALASEDPIAVSPVPAPAPAALQGTSATNVIVGPFVPTPGRPIVLTLSGTWEGAVQVKRSVDGGVTMHALTAGGFAWGNFTENVCEPVWEEQEAGTQLHLDITLTSGTIAYRIAQ